MINKQSIKLIHHNGMFEVFLKERFICKSINKDLALRKALYYLGLTCICGEGRTEKK